MLANVRKYAYNEYKGSDSMLKDMRESKGLSRKEVSERSGINFRSLQDYEQGHKSIASAKGETLYRLSLTLGCTMEELVIGELNRKKDSEGLTGHLRIYAEYMDKYYPWKADVEELMKAPDTEVYYLMHRDDIVTVLAFDIVSGNIIRIGKRVNDELLPLGANLSAKDLKSWWVRRAVPLGQGNIKRLLLENQVPTPQNYLLLNLGMSLSDHYWVNPANKFYKWKDVNLFTNDFYDELGNYDFSDSFSKNRRNIALKNRTVFSPSGSQQGELQKKWIIREGKRYLIKRNLGHSCQQSINEAIASLIHEKQGKVQFVKYKLCDVCNSGNQEIGCICEDFCTEEIEFIPALDVVNSVKKANDVSMYEHFIKVCEKNGLLENDVRSFLEYQILTDFLISNTDRHLYNFGVLRDSKTLEFIGMAPVFDSGNSLFWDKKKIPVGQEILKISVNSFLKEETALLKYVKSPMVLDLTKLPTDEGILELLNLDAYCMERSRQILDAYHEKIDLIEQLQNGTMIYKYGFKIQGD